MRIRAAVVSEPGGPFMMEELELSDPRPDEVLIRVVSVGICRTDLHIRDREYSVPPFPIVAGHEAVGVIERVGGIVTDFRPGDAVLTSYPSCGDCRFCAAEQPPYCTAGFDLSFSGSRLDGSSALTRTDGSRVNGHVFQQSSFATHAVVHHNNVVHVPDDAPPLESLAPLGCGVQTGAGTVIKALRVGRGSSVAVWGTGSVGLVAVMAAAAAGAAIVIAIDTRPARLDLARQVGATHVINACDEDVAGRISEVALHGVDFGIETTADPRVLADALASIAMTGELALIGAAAAGTTSKIDMNTLLNGRRLRGVIQGDAVPQTFLPHMIRMHQQGVLPFDRLITYYEFEDIDRAVADMTSGAVIKPVLRMPVV